MTPHNPLQRLSATVSAFPRAFWMVVIVHFIDRLGASLLLPFFSMYVTWKFGVGMTDVGLLFAVWAAAGFIGSFLGGALADRLGRRRMIMFSLVATSLTALGLGLVNAYGLFFAVGFVSGIFIDVGSPAYNAIVADLLPEKQRAQGYGIIRVAVNLAVVIGPAVGGFLATRSYLALFITDAAISLVAAAVVFFTVPETRPEVRPGTKEESAGDSFKGYGRVLRDAPFVAFGLVSLLAWLAYMNMGVTLGVYLRDWHSLPEAGYGLLLSLNALLVVLFQFPITRRLEKRPPMLMMALGALLLGGGFALYGVFTTFALFLVAMVVITAGEMIMIPISNALVIEYAPEDMRGRYNFVYGLSWGLAYAGGPLLAGLVMDGPEAAWLWYACGLLGVFAALGFLALHRQRSRQSSAPLEEPA